MSDNSDSGAVGVTFFRPLDGSPLLVELETAPADNSVEYLQLESRGFTEFSADSPGARMPFGFSNHIRPVDCSAAAIAAWVDLMFKSLTWLEQDQLAGNEALNALDRDGNKQNATDIIRDAFLLVDALLGDGWSNGPKEPADEIVSFHAAKLKLREVREWLRNGANEPESQNQNGPTAAPNKAAAIEQMVEPQAKHRTLSDVIEFAERHLDRNPWPGNNAMATLAGCANSTMSKAVQRSMKLLTAASNEKNKSKSVSAQQWSEATAASVAAQHEQTEFSDDVAGDDVLTRLKAACRTVEELERLEAMPKEDLVEIAKIALTDPDTGKPSKKQKPR